MDAAKNLNAAMRYIEKQMLGEIDYNEIARIVGCSEYQFRRMFSHLADMPLNEYIRRRRLSLAVDMLRSGGDRIIDIAHKCGYHSHDSFGKAFQAQYGITPSECRKRSDALKAFPPLFFHLSLIGCVKMDCNIVEKKEMLFEGCLIKHKGGNSWSKWEEMDSVENDPRYAHYHGVDDYPNESRAFEVRFYPDDGKFIFTGTEVTREEPGVAWEYLRVPAALYAVFDIDEKADTKPQFQGVNNWLEENKDTYKQMIWDADGRVSPAIFAVCQWDHRGKYQKDKIMELWIPLVRI
jgi:AraC-like DNA-binding protein